MSKALTGTAVTFGVLVLIGMSVQSAIASALFFAIGYCLGAPKGA